MMGDWQAVSALATVVGAFAAWYYVRLTHKLWRATAGQVEIAKKNSEAELMLRLMMEYDFMRPQLNTLREWWPILASDNQIQQMKRFAEEQKDALDAGREYNINEARHRISRFFVRIRKLAQAGYLSEDLIVAALDADAIDLTFLKRVDPLDELVAPTSYKCVDRQFFADLLGRRYGRHADKAPDA